MNKDMLMWDETLFRDGSVLELDHLPDHFSHRETQMQSLMYSLRPALRGMRPINSLLSGPPGTGKTTTVMKVFGEMKKHAGNVVFVKVNCQMDSTKFAVIARIYKALFKVSPPASGVAFRKLFEKVMNFLIENEKTLVVCLDDINYLYHEGNADDVMYSMLRAHEQFPGAKVGVIAIVSDTGKLYQFDPKVNSVFLPEEVAFPRYGSDELQDILGRRIDLAFYPNVVSDEVKDAIVEYVDMTGDLRVGIDLLKRSGLNAERRASRTISVEDVESAYERSRLLHLGRSIMSLTPDERTLLGLIAKQRECQTGDLYKLFHEQTGLGYTRFYDMVNKLNDARYVSTDFSGKGTRGRTRIVKPRYQPEDILKCLE
ncbi:ORC complex protein Cdc6/Orc1 [Methanococcoides vulcani]|uniref:ORC1-type DNA replication protein n=1 Tax=Methanococcoides vulcani TaxID=1353158 RepID=A0A1H9ZDS5_9EURY|nr:ORC1-type DNA replication protein [Methanococcoides vulcani]SES79005.1 ORC complex protein Cdc6/Orc1 [Methanococcoides vulcani]